MPKSSHLNDNKARFHLVEEEYYLAAKGCLVVRTKMLYCTKCGKSAREGSFFCEECGTRIPIERDNPPPPSTTVNTAIQNAKKSWDQKSTNKFSAQKSVTQSSGEKVPSITALPDLKIGKSKTFITSTTSSGLQRKNRRRVPTYALIFVIISSVLAAIAGFMILNITTYSLIDTITMRKYPASNVTGLQINVSGKNVKISVSTTPMSNFSYEIVEKVYGASLFRKDSNYEILQVKPLGEASGDAKHWDGLEFTDDSSNFYRYELEIKLHPSLKAALFIETDVGSVELHLRDNALEKYFFINTNVGSIQAILTNVSLSLDLLMITSDVGSIDFNLKQVNILNSTRKIVLETNVGSIDLETSELMIQNSLSWSLTSDIGSVYAYLKHQENLPESPWSVFNNMSFRTNSGSIDVSLQLSEVIGLRIEAHANAGSATIPQSTTNETETNVYQNSNYSTASLKYNLILSSSLGSITVEY